MAQQPRTLKPHETPWHFLGAELRSWREHRGLSQARLAREVHVSAALIAKVEKAERRPAADLVLRCDRTLRTEGALTRLLAFIDHHGTAEPGIPTVPASITIVVMLPADDHAASGTLHTAGPPSPVRQLDAARRKRRLMGR